MNASRSRAGSRFGPYELRSLLGRGGMGEVYEAYDTHNDRVVALKLLPAELAQDPTYRERFRRESHAATRIDDPHIVPINRSGEIEGTLYLDMRLIRGDDLRALLRRQGAMEPERAVHIVAQVGAALDAAHAAGLVHRDVKPANILVTPTDFAFLTDFGIARTEGDSSTTMVGITAGSYTYMAPERFDSGPITGRADTYSLACVLFECLTGATPFAVHNVSTLIRSHLSDPPPRPSLYRSDVPSALDAVIAHAMSKSPADRFPSTGEFAGAARAAVGLTPGAGSDTDEYADDWDDTPTEMPAGPARLAAGPGALPPVAEATTFQPFGPQGPTIVAQFQPRGGAQPDAEPAGPVPPVAGSPTTVMRTGAPPPPAGPSGAPPTPDSPTSPVPGGAVPPGRSPGDDVPANPAAHGYTTTGSLRIIVPPSPEDRDTGSDLPVITPTDATQVRREEFPFTPLPAQAELPPTTMLPTRGLNLPTPDSNPPSQGLILPSLDPNPPSQGLLLPPPTPSLPRRETAPRTELLPSTNPARDAYGRGERDAAYGSEPGAGGEYGGDTGYGAEGGYPRDTAYSQEAPYGEYGHAGRSDEEYDRGGDYASGGYEHGGYPPGEYRQEPGGYDTSGDYDHPGHEHGSGAGGYAYSEGEYGTAAGEYGHTEGEYSAAAGEYGYAEGEYGAREGGYAYGEGEYAAEGEYSAADGHYGYADGEYREGEYLSADQEYDSAEGDRARPKRSVAVPLVLSVLGVALAAGAAVVGWQVLGKPANSADRSTAAQHSAPALASPPASAPDTTAATTTSAAGKTPPADATVCRSTASIPDSPITKSASGSSGTTCGFAEAVRKAYAAAATESGSATPSSVVAVSPATGHSYTLSCEATGRLITCTGGEGALVYLY